MRKLKTKEKLAMRELRANPIDAAKPKHKDTYINNQHSTIKRTKTKKGIRVNVSYAAAYKSSAFFKMRPGETLWDKKDLDGKILNAGYRSRIETYKRDVFIKDKEDIKEYLKRLYISPDEKKKKWSKMPPFRGRVSYARWSRNPKYGRMEIEVIIEDAGEWTIHRIVPMIEE